MRARLLLTLAGALAVLLPPLPAPARASAVAGTYEGLVLDAATGRPIVDALVTVGSMVSRTDQGGRFRFAAEGDTLAVRAVGHRRAALPAVDLAGKAAILRLPPLTVKALYLSVYGIGNRGLRTEALRLVRQNDLNALVIDFKGDRGLIPCGTALPLAAETGAHAVTTVRDMADLVWSLRGKGLYLIARIVVFKDTLLAQARPAWAVRTRDGSVWRDREGLAWVDPFLEEAWSYTVDIAVEAARLGFDEIQFDYVRFPDTNGLVFSRQSTEEERVRAISGFLASARRALAPYNVFLAADIFGYVLWNRNDTDIGQKLEALPDQVDYLSPMLYPTTFQFGIPGHRIPVEDPYAIVYESLWNARLRLGIAPVRFRPWLQAFRDYAFDRRQFGGRQIRDQIRAAEKFGAQGWMLWNPLNQYNADGLHEEPGRSEAAGGED